MSNSERESVSDRMPFYRFCAVAGLSGMIAFTLAIALLVQVFRPAQQSRVDPTAIIFALQGLLALWMPSPEQQKKKEPEQQAIAQSGGLIVQEQGSNQTESES
jgi:hypothetical protein